MQVICVLAKHVIDTVKVMYFTFKAYVIDAREMLLIDWIYQNSI